MARQEWMYALPFGFGDIVYNYDRMKDFNEMHKDFTRNTGRTYKYPTQGFNAQKYRSMALVIDGALRSSSRAVTLGRKLPGQRGGGTTTRNVMTLDQF